MKNVCYMKNGVIEINGDICWYKNDLLHREDGPAVICAIGDRYWYFEDKLHRKDGPAVETVDGYKEWWVNGKLYMRDTNGILEVESEFLKNLIKNPKP